MGPLFLRVYLELAECPLRRGSIYLKVGKGTIRTSPHAFFPQLRVTASSLVLRKMKAKPARSEKGSLLLMELEVQLQPRLHTAATEVLSLRLGLILHGFHGQTKQVRC